MNRKLAKKADMTLICLLRGWWLVLDLDAVLMLHCGFALVVPFPTALHRAFAVLVAWRAGKQMSRCLQSQR